MIREQLKDVGYYGDYDPDSPNQESTEREEIDIDDFEGVQMEGSAEAIYSWSCI